MKIAILVDANIYLELYPGDVRLQTSLTSLVKLPGLFVSQQIVEEVTRRRVSDGTVLLNLALKKIAKIDLPPLVTSLLAAPVAKDLETLNSAASNLKRSLDEQLTSIVAKMVEGTDPVTRSLQPLFAKAVGPSTEELARARDRKERGNPPGKQGQPLGDQLTWEQFLSHAQGAERVVVVSRDGDYAAGWSERLFLNPLLAADLQRVAPGCEPVLYKELPEALKAVNALDATVEIPSEAELAAAKEAEKEAAAVGIDALIAAVSGTSQPTGSLYVFGQPQTLSEGVVLLPNVPSGTFLPRTMELLRRGWSEEVVPVLPPKAQGGVELSKVRGPEGETKKGKE